MAEMLKRLNHYNGEADDAALRELAARVARPGAVAVEVGVWTGETTVLLADAALTVYAVDHWRGSPDDKTQENLAEFGREEVYATFLDNISSRLFRSIFPLVGSSAFWSDRWSFGLIDLLFIDADHRYEEVKRDIERWAKWVRPGGILSGHDYSGEVKQAVDELLGTVHTAGGSVWWKFAGDSPCP